VNDNFYFVHRSLAGNGAITVRVTSLTDGAFPNQGAGSVAAQPWAKAGIMLKDGTQAGSAYAAVLATPGHGVRMQYDFTHDTPGLPGAVSSSSPRWLRLVRSGDTITGYDSADGSHWATIGTATLAGLPSSVQAGLFVASPQALRGGNETFTQASARFDDVGLQGGWSPGAWGQCEVGASLLGGGIADGCAQPSSHGIQPGSVTESDGTFAVTGTGDVSPYVPAVDILGGVFKGTLAGLVALLALGAVFVTSEYRRGMTRTTFAGTPRRGRVILAKTIVIGAVAFAVGLAGAAIALAIALLAGRIFLPGNGFTAAHGFLPLSITHGPTLRAGLGSVLYLVLVALLSLGVAAAVRDTAVGIAIVGGLMYVLPAVIGLALDPAWQHRVLRVTPMSAGLTIQSTTSLGKLPIAPWPAIGVLAAWTAAALLIGWLLLRLRDA